MTVQINTWLTDMDGVLVHEQRALPGAADFIKTLRDNDRNFLVLTNNPMYTPRDLSARLKLSGIEIPEENIWTSALATAQFVSQTIPRGSAYVIGEAGLTTALHETGYILSDRNPDYVILGETRNYSFEAITTAIRLILDGARFICTNPDNAGPSDQGILPSTGAVAALITNVTGREPYFIGKPNPIMFRTALNRVGGHSANTAMIGDRMDTDVIAGVEAGLHTFLTLTGVTQKDQVEDYPFRPSHVVNSIADLIPIAESGVVEEVEE